MIVRIPELDELGERLGAALANPSRRPRRAPPRRLALAVALLGALAVPAYAGQQLLAPLINGETPLPSQAPAGARTQLAVSDVPPRGPYRLVAYPTRLHARGGRGLCLFLTTPAGGTGTCGPIQLERDVLLATPQFGDTVVLARVSDRVARVRLEGPKVSRRSVRPVGAPVRGAGFVRYVLVPLGEPSISTTPLRPTLVAVDRHGRVLGRVRTAA